MTLSLHTQVEDLTNLLRRRRSDRLHAESRQQAYRSLVAAILDVPVTSIGEPSPATVAPAPLVLRSTRRTRVA